MNIDNDVVLRMIVEEVHFYIVTYLSLVLTLLLLWHTVNTNHPGLQPSPNRMIGIDSVIELYLLTLLPLLKYAGRINGNRLIILSRPSRVVHVDGAMAHKQYLRVDPLANRVLDV